MTDKPVIAFLPTGGTIQMTGQGRLDLAWYRGGHTWQSVDEMSSRLPEISSIADVRALAFDPVASPQMTVEQLLQIARRADAALSDDDVDGIVVLHGTATLEETAYFLHLVSRSSKPIVLVGAMRPPSGLSSDADMNLLNAVRVAASVDSRGMGALVVMNDGIHSAREVTKGSTWGLDAFTSRNSGPLGYVDGYGRVIFRHLPFRPHTAGTPFDVEGVTSLPRVDIALSYLGSGRAAIDAFIDSDAAGIIFACTGSDGMTLDEEAALDRAIARGVTVALASRTGSGRIEASPALRARGFIAVGDLLPWKARLLLMIGLGQGLDAEAIQGLFDRY